MSKLKSVFMYVWRLWYVKYAAVTVVGVLLVGFVGDYSVLGHLRNKQRISELQQEIDLNLSHYRHDEAQLRQLDKDPKAMERIARERYFMKEDDEDIFVLSDDDREVKPIVSNEAAQ